MRKLPVYLLLDCSGSMTGEPIEAVRNGLQTPVVALRQDPHALESAHLSVITFSDTAIVFLMTDGDATDDITLSIEAIKKAKLGTFVACAAGPNAKTNDLLRITENVVKLDTTDSNTIKAYFKWVSASIAPTSQKVDLTKKESASLSDLPPPPPEVNIVV